MRRRDPSPPAAFPLPQSTPLLLATALGLLGAACGKPIADAAPPAPPAREAAIEPTAAQALVINDVDVDPRVSLLVTDVATLARFNLGRVLDQIVAQVGTPGLTGSALFRQLWDTENPAPGLDATKPHSGDVSSPFPFARTRVEGGQANDPNVVGNYITTALVNRVDLIPSDGANCGEYRLIAARSSGQTNSSSRAFVIFEAVLPNPRPDLGVQGCRPVQAFWRDLSGITDPTLRGARLEQFYFDGLPGFRPAIHVSNYGDAPGAGGRVRTNQFMQPPWILREFKLALACATQPCSLVAQPVTVKNTPFPTLYSGDNDAFNGYLVGQVANLAGSLDAITLQNDDRFNGFESVSQVFDFINDPISTFLRSNSQPTGPLRSRLDAELARIGSPLSAQTIVERAVSQGCAGCHMLVTGHNLGTADAPAIFPSNASVNGFVQVSEQLENTQGPSPRFRISDGLANGFLPQRLTRMTALLGAPAAPTRARKAIGSIVVDGNLDEPTWELAQAVTKPVVGTSSSRVSYAVTWNQTFLFVGYRVLDDKLVNDSADPWQDDSVELYLDADHNRATSYDAFDRQFVKGWGDATVFERAGRTAGVLSATAPIVGGYSVELAVPWSNLGVSPSAGAVLGFDVAVNDDDDGSNREGQLMWWGNNNDWADTTGFGAIVLDANGAPPNAIAARTTVAPTIDGKLTEVGWNLAFRAEKPVLGTLLTKATTWGAQWDADALYVGVKVQDDVLVADSVDPWQDDAIEIYLDGQGNKGTSYDAFDRQFVARVDATTLFERFGNLNGVTFATARTPDGYSVELRVPWTQLGAAGTTAFAGRLLGIDVGVDDDRDGGNRDGQAMWAGTANNWTSPAAWGTLQLGN